MKLNFTVLLSFIAFSYCNVQYLIGEQGQSCFEACYNAGKNCNPTIFTNNSTLIFTQLGIKCEADNTPWSAEDQPSYVSDPSDTNYGKCQGFINIPTATQCSGNSANVKRLCRCDDPSDAPPAFGTGYSNGKLTTEERWIFHHIVAPGDVGVLTHFWITYATEADNGTIVRYYIDGEKEASIQFTPSMACGVGFYDKQAPWGTEWFGKGADDSGWYNNFRIPFQKSIVVTLQHQYNNYTRGFYMILKGSVNVPIIIGGRTLPSTAKMNQVRINDTFQVLDWGTLVNVTSGPGAHWMVTMAVESGNLDFLEGCIHAYFDGNNEFPGVILGTGTEDYFDSAHFFNAGQYHMPVSGFTHLNQNSSYVSWSAYRFHDVDPLFFKNGFQLIWRNGDMDDLAGMKCHIISGGKIHRNPTVSKLYAYAWYYTWPAK